MPEPAADIASRVESAPESAYAWTRLFAALVLSAIGGVGMWSVIVALPAVQAEFGVARSAASLPYLEPVPPASGEVTRQRRQFGHCVSVNPARISAPANAVLFADGHDNLVG